MAVVRLKGLNRVRKRLKDGSEVVHYYAWKGGPKLTGKPGDPDFIPSYLRAVAQRRAPSTDDLASLVARYRASPEYAGLADGTKRQWARWLDRIAATAGDLDLGSLPLRLLDDRRVRADILGWRDQWAASPRSADYAMQVLSRVLAFGVDRGLLAINAVAGVSQLYSNDRADQIWDAGELARYQAAAGSPEVGHIVRLACLTGLRRADLCRLAWAHVGDVAIVIPTGKSRGRKSQVIPLLDQTKALLAEIRQQQAARLAEVTEARRKKKLPPPPTPTTVLTSAKHVRAWTPDGLEHQVNDAKTAAGIDKHLHDARGTFATFLRTHGKLTAPEIADVMAWDEARVERLLSTYVDRDAIVLSIAARLNRKDPEA